MRWAVAAAIASFAAAAFVYCALLQGLPALPAGATRRPVLKARNAGERAATPQTATAPESTCRLSNWVTLGKCRKATTEPGCYEAYTNYLDAGCLCDYHSYPWVFLPKDISPLGFTWALMETTPPHQLDDIIARAPCLETPADCRAPRDGDVKLSAYMRGWLAVYHAGDWRHVVGRLSNATARAQCQRLAFADGWADESAALAAAPADAVAAVALNESCVLARRPFAECLRPAPRVDPAESGAGAARARVECLHSTDGRAHGPIGCFVDRYGVPTCLRGSGAATERYLAGAAIDAMPSLGCGTAGTRFLERPPLRAPSDAPAEPADASGAGCRVLFADTIQRCTAADDARRRMCSASCHDAFIRAIRREDCFDERVGGSGGGGGDVGDGGGTYADALKRSAEVIYTQCGQDLWQSAALAADTYDGCVELLLDAFRRCQSDSEKHLCSAACADKLDEASGAESCYSVRYYRGESRAFRGHVALLDELRQRVCVWMPDAWPDDGGASDPDGDVRYGGYAGSYGWRRRRQRR